MHLIIFSLKLLPKYKQKKINSLLLDASIVRNRAKIQATITGAQIWLEIMEEPGGFTNFVWEIMGGKPKINKWRSSQQVPAQTIQAEQLSKKLKARGFNFVGPSICYAFMQAAGFVNDHLVSCFRHDQLAKK